METLELHPTRLDELVAQLTFQLKRSLAQGVQVKEETDAVRVDGRLGDAGWSVEWNQPVCTWRFGESEIRFVLVSFQTSLQLRQRSFTLLIKARKAAGGSPFDSLEEDFYSLWHNRKNPLQEVFLRRAFNALVHLGDLSDPVLKRAISAPSDQGVVVTALQSPEALAPAKALDPLLDARLRGIAAKQRLLESHGGSISADDAARLLKITRQAIDKRRKNNQLLAVELGKRGYYYPVWQFGDSGTLPGLEKVLKALKDHDPWMQLAFFLAPSSWLDNKAPFQALSENRSDQVEIAARAYGEQGAA